MQSSIQCQNCGIKFTASCGAARYCTDTCKFFAKFEFTDGCWLWKSSKDRSGYGIIMLPGRKFYKAHRFSYQFFVGKIPDGLVVCHKCDVRACVNPSHLFLGSLSDNRQDCIEKSRHAKGEGIYWKAKITEKDVLAIRSDNRTAAKIAAAYGICRNNVFHIKRRRTWKHV